jgi:hypothetical protein
MTTGLLISRQTKAKLHKIAVTNRLPEDILKFKQYRNVFNSLIRTSKKLYFEQNLCKNKGNSRKTWELLKEATNLTKSNNKIEKIKVNDVPTDNPTDMANAFNEFFSSIGTDISNSVPHTNTDPLSYIDTNDDLNLLDLGNTSPTHVCDIIKSMIPKNSMDLDGISTKLIKSIATEISVPLAYIFNLSLNTGIFPNKLKTSRIVPIFKTGDAELCDNYRPISLLSSLSKILEKMVSIQLINHLDRNKLLYEISSDFSGVSQLNTILLKLLTLSGKQLTTVSIVLGYSLT